MSKVKAVAARIPIDLYDKLKYQADSNLRSIAMEISAILRLHFYTQKRGKSNGRQSKA